MELYEINKSLQDFKKRLDELVKAINLPKLDEELLDYKKVLRQSIQTYMNTGKL